ncbi:Lrp/AsnC family transcriptional regulator [Plastoroseomonas hellenica]|uniref:Lrp/AsnC family transcriptional regulator n=1 Tax=Plastoroseomonas hellenica TaxID=2687306 RepID=UPI001BADB68C|nr:Lrp/AsnC family transcriptional regulator [Plastoroseomonas hellenica]MBR0642744.1 Lrp/AsnC family transcriptional regulator [Plastoroseomonas hellenica]
MHNAASLDSLDLRLLMALQEDGRLTNQQLGDRIGLSASQCSRRRSALEAAGLISGYRAELAAEALGLSVLAFIQVTLAAHSGNNSRRFREMLAGVDAIQEAYAMTGDTDYLLKARVPDLKGLSRLVNDTLLAHATVARVRSSIVLERLKESGRLPLAGLEQIAGGRNRPEA